MSQKPNAGELEGAPDNTRPPRAAHAIAENDHIRLTRWLGDNVEGCRGAAITVRQFKGGQSNPTYWIRAQGGSGGDVALALRKKPPGALLPSAHAIEREYRVMAALGQTDVPVPRALALCEDESVLGKPFFVMSYVPGTIFWDPTLPELADNDARRAYYREYVRVLAAIHKVDFRAVGLGDYGKVGGYVGRQIDRWSQQYEASRTDDVPAMNRLIEWLRANVPANDETTLIHGDYRIDNLVVAVSAARDGANEDAVGAGREPRVRAVLDWELSTLGHPLSDLAYACLGYHLNLPGRSGLAGVDLASLGIPTESELVDLYCSATGRRGVPDFATFIAFGMFRLAAIVQGVYKRSLQGNASSDDAATYGSAVPMLAELACEVVGM